MKLLTTLVLFTYFLVSCSSEESCQGIQNNSEAWGDISDAPVIPIVVWVSMGVASFLPFSALVVGVLTSASLLSVMGVSTAIKEDKEELATKCFQEEEKANKQNKEEENKVDEARKDKDKEIDGLDDDI